MNNPSTSSRSELVKARDEMKHAIDLCDHIGSKNISIDYVKAWHAALSAASGSGAQAVAYNPEAPLIAMNPSSKVIAFRLIYKDGKRSPWQDYFITHDVPDDAEVEYAYTHPRNEARGEWQPIETAPKGQQILVASSAGMSIATVEPRGVLSYCDGEAVQDPNSGWVLEIDNPTHWMLLPAAPVEAARTAAQEKGNE